MSGAWATGAWAIGAWYGTAWFVEGAPTPTPTPTPRPTATTIGGIGEYTIEFPRTFEKPLPKFKRNMENQDRRDIADIVLMLQKSGWLP